MRNGRMLQRFVAGVIAVGIMASTAVAFAQSAPPPGPPAPGQHQGVLTPEDREAMAQIFWNRMKGQLGLSDEQVADLRNTMQTQRQTMRPQFQALREARKQFRDLMQQNPPADPGSIKAAADNLSNLQTALSKARIDNQLALRAKLTPDQLSKWIELRKSMRPRWGGQHRMGGGMGFGPAM